MEIRQFLGSDGFSGIMSGERSQGEFARLVLIEAAKFGMPPQIVAMLDEIGALLGLYTPLPENAVNVLGGAPVLWRSSDNPSNDTAPEILRLALAQRAEVAFGYRQGHLVGPAELVTAMASLTDQETPPGYREVFQWAMCHTIAEMFPRRYTPADYARTKGWDFIPDARVLEGTGDLNETYVTCARAIRRAAINSLGDEHSPRQIAAAIAHSIVDAAETRLAEDETLSEEGKEGFRKAAAHFRGIATDYGYPTLASIPSLKGLNLEEAQAS